MLQISPVEDSNCQGFSVDVTDADALAKAVALILVQEFTLATQLAADPEAPMAAPTRDHGHIEDIIARRLRPADGYHRDGLLFQLVMWLAAHLDLEDGDLVALPHTQGAAKGQDSLIVHRSSDAVIALSICEDKATENPRDTVRDQVWPEIKEYESGGRQDELRSGLIATLGTGGIGTSDAERLIRKISWQGMRRYRVRVTLEEQRSPRLFDGFPSLVAGTNEMRRGETTFLPSMRVWMDDFALNVEAELRSMVVTP